MIPIEISEEIRQKVPKIRLGCLQCQVEVLESPPELLQEMEEQLARRESDLGETAAIAQLPEIAATRVAYKALGKDPARYRPSAEALLRRVLKGKGLYHINNVVDLLNLVSVMSGFSIGGWDYSYIEDKMVLGVGQEEEPYAAVGRGSLNIAGLPVFRDEKGAFGTPTSDSERTRVRPESRDFLMAFYDFGASEQLQTAMDMARNLLKRYASAQAFESQIL